MNGGRHDRDDTCVRIGYQPSLKGRVSVVALTAEGFSSSSCFRHLNSSSEIMSFRGGSRGRVQGVRTPPEMTCGFLIQLVFCKKKNYVVYWC